MKKTLFLLYAYITFRFFSKIYLQAEWIILNFRALEMLLERYLNYYFLVAISKKSACQHSLSYIINKVDYEKKLRFVLIFLSSLIIVNIPFGYFKNSFSGKNSAFF
ncbi:hypothetical protein BBI01_09840 [Chryseobacterium artocarpi]|uniref:Uncharacterized protein n=1 Tax=Chryseobacterium artocarpi TaxID=1414727 RepID=A0A1B8ZLJ4_9FLAO|nr:hypothetical protein BBI01_09840 [Chryseobacterium artocarpi]